MTGLTGRRLAVIASMLALSAPLPSIDDPPRASRPARRADPDKKRRRREQKAARRANRGSR